MKEQKLKVKFKDLQRGYIDGKSESIYNRENFKNAFYDLGEVLHKLKNMNYPTSILIGRKGVGKSAYGAKLTMLKDIKSFDIDLGELP